jgi:hypothetical protein
MTTDDKSQFAHAFNRLAKMGFIHEIDAVTLALYFDTLSDLPLWAIERAELHLRRHPVRFFTSAEWHACAANILREQRRRDTVTLAQQKLLPAQCPACRDTGWRPTLIDPDRVEACSCRETNPNYLANRAREAMVADGRADHPSPTEAAEITSRIAHRDFKQLAGGGE